MNKRGLLLLLIPFIVVESPAQKHDYIWLFGYQSNPTDTTFGGTNINFNISPPDVHYIFREMDMGSTNASISDEDGNLLFYTNGCDIAGADQVILNNGTNINPGAIHDDWCFNYGSYPGLSAALIVPVANDKYFLMHKDMQVFTNANPPSQDVYPVNLYYSIVNVSNLTVEEKNVSLLQDTLTGADMAAVKHANNEDWWFLTHKRDTNLFFKFLISEDTILGPYYQDIGLPITRMGSGGGQSVFSPDGNMFVYYDPNTDISIYDFDRGAGELSNFRHLVLADSAFVSFGGAAISSNSRFLYITNMWDAYQYDLYADDIEASKVHIGHFDGFTAPFATNLYRMQLAPDCKIYMNSTNGVNFLHVIHNPNRKGLDCDFEQHAIELPTYNSTGSLPTFPNYRLGTGEVCDSTISIMSGILPVIKLDGKLSVYPNPFENELNISLENETIKEINIYDLSGRLIVTKKSATLPPSSTIHVLSLEGFSSGTYLLEVISDKGRYIDRIVKSL